MLLTAADLPSGGADVLEELRRERLISLSGFRREDTAQTRHDRIRETLVATLPEERQAAIHGGIARAAEAASRFDPERLAHHYSRSTQRAKAASFAEQAGDLACHAFAFERAARLYRLAFECGDPGTDRRDLRVRLAHALSQAGRAREAATEFLIAADEHSGAASIDHRRRAAEELLTSGEVDDGLMHVHDVLNALGMHVPRTPGLALASLLMSRARLRWRGYRTVVRTEAEISSETRIRIDTCYSLARGLGFIDGIRGSRFQTENLLAALDAGEPKRILRAMSAEIAYAASEGPQQRSRVEALLNHSRKLAAQIEDHDVLGLAMVTEGMAYYFFGDLPWGLHRTQEATAYLERYGAGAFELNSARYVTMMLLKLMGQPARMASLAPGYIDDALRRGDRFAEVQLRMEATHFIALAADDPVEANEQIQQGVRNWSQSSFYLQHYWELVFSADVQLYLGHGAAAVTHLESRWSDLRRSLLLRCFVVDLEFRMIRGRAHLMAALHETGRSKARHLKLAEADAHAMGKTRIPIALGLMSLLLAGVAAQRAVAASARKWLDMANDGFSRGHMALHREAVRARLGSLAGDRARSEAAYATMRTLGVKNPERMTASLLPWPGR